jgi:MFS transporter, DHA2 family, multidrug resistance protein
MPHSFGPFTIPDIRDFVPEKVKPWILIAFVIIFQLSGGVYLASVSEMTGSLALMHEDIMMAGYASLVGMALTFTFMYRLKFRFAIKTSLLSTALGLIICNLISMHTRSVPMLVAVSFIAGFFRMWGTFACNTTIQLWITPKRDMAVWFVFIYLLVQSSIQLTGLVTIYTSFLSKWEYMHWLVVGLLLFVMLVTFVVFRHYRSMKKLPLYGIDWMGMFLWAATVLCFIFVLNYGEHFDWYQSDYIRIGTVFGAMALGLNLWRATFIRHPFIALKTWTFRHVWLTFLLYIMVNILVSPAHFFEHIYTEAILGYDTLNVVSLNWIVLFGIVCGAFFTYHAFALRKWTFKTMTLIGFSLIVGYLLVMYFIIDYNLPKEMLYFPVFLRGTGYVIIAITFITALSGIPFQNFFQSLTIQAFISACLGSLIGSAVLTRVFNVTLKKNAMLLSANLDDVNPLANHISTGSLFGSLQQQAMMVSMKEIYGWLCILGIFCLLAFFLRESSLRPKFLHPKFSTMRHTVKHELKLDVILKED